MESLRSIFKAKLRSVKDSDAEPTPAAMADFLRKLTVESGRAARNCHPDLTSIIIGHYKDNLNWDVKENRGLGDEPPTIDDITDFLTQSLAAIDDFHAALEPTEEELEDITQATDRMWKLDDNRLTPEVEYSINLQDSTKVYHDHDAAHMDLFDHLDDSVLERPIYKAFKYLLDNYEAETGGHEHRSHEESQEERLFINLICDTPVMLYTFKYLVAKGFVPDDMAKFKATLWSTWFGFYSRKGGKLDSSGFEHVFVGESKGDDVVGLHNWVQVYNEEKAKRLDYKGFIHPKGHRRRGYEEPEDADQVITVQFEWNGEMKPVSTMFMGVSPEFEVALYTLLFLSNIEKQVCELGPYRVEITVYSYRHDGKHFIGTSFPSGVLESN